MSEVHDTSSGLVLLRFDKPLSFLVTLFFAEIKAPEIGEEFSVSQACLVAPARQGSRR
jgi:hypothetical protein